MRAFPHENYPKSNPLKKFKKITARKVIIFPCRIACIKQLLYYVKLAGTACKPKVVMSPSTKVKMSPVKGT
jgi:hypothetical protein